jgi:hypothetical protein
MSKIIRNIRSAINFSVAIFELMISLLLAVKFFSADVASNYGFSVYFIEFLRVSDNEKLFSANRDLSAPISFLIVVIIFMLFGHLLINLVLGISAQERSKYVTNKRYRNFMYAKKRFNKNRFL